MTERITFDLDLIKRYDKSGPRYTSYPTAPQMQTSLGETEYRRVALQTNEGASPRPLSLYFHLPFCNTVCYYCGCNKIVTKDRSRARPYLDRLEKELTLQGELYDRSRPVTQLHWGGGTPTFISHEEMEQLMRQTARHFSLLPDDEGEYSIELDPREVKPGTLQLLRKLGFNRMSMGVQDFDPKVQEAVNRIQPESDTLAVLHEARQLGFRSINMDLIYGLPFQSVASFTRTLDKIIEAEPDRLSVFNYAHLPEMFKPQRRINEADLPAPSAKLEILQMVIEKLTDAGYEYIGMDHFAKPDDELAVAQKNGTLYRNFQGYSTHADCDLVGMGVTAISMVGSSYWQNVKTESEYNERLDNGLLPVFRGLLMSEDDRIRRAVIMQLICHFRLDFKQIEDQFRIRFAEYFAEELSGLASMQQDGLLELDESGLKITDRGVLLIRNICMLFDAYIQKQRQQGQYSKVI
ncbi:MAG: oxygen-independent coproporphyrinogen III oxidase [Acidiferrobacterales bacterium]